MTQFIIVSSSRTDAVGPFDTEDAANKACAKLTKLVASLAKKRKVGYIVGPWYVRQIKTTDETVKELKEFYS